MRWWLGLSKLSDPELEKRLIGYENLHLPPQQRRAKLDSVKPKVAMLVVFLIMVACGLAASAGALAQGAIDTDPAKQRPGFKPNQLSFETPQDGVARAEFRSQPFYAVILKTVQRCSAVEKERVQIQNLFPANKVFAPMFDCDDAPEDTIRYTNVNPAVGFIGVYAGEDLDTAERVLESVRRLGMFPGANLRRMQAVLVYP